MTKNENLFYELYKRIGKYNFELKQGYISLGLQRSWVYS